MRIEQTFNGAPTARGGSRQRPLRIAGAVLLVGILAASALLGGFVPAPTALLVLAGFATLGVGFLLALLFGFVRFRFDRYRDRVAKELLERPDRPVVVTDSNGDVVLANEAYVSLAPSNGLALAPIETWGADRATRTALTDLFAETRHGRSGRAVIRVDGSQPKWLDVSAYPLQGRDPNSSVAWEITDVTADRAADERAYRATREAVAFLDRAPVGFVATREDGVINHLNATVADWLDIDLTAFQRSELRLTDMLTAESVVALEEARAEEGESRTIRAEAVTSHGDRRSVLLFERTIEAPSARHLLTLVDANAAMDVPHGQSQSEASIDRFYDRMPVAFAILADDGTLERPNRAFATMFGLNPKDRPTNLQSIVPPQARDAIERAIAGQGAGEPVELVIPATDTAKDRFITLDFAAVDGVGGNEGRSLLVHAREATEQKAIEAAYIQGQKMQAVGLLAGGLAHDFNNVLSAITMSADLLLETHGVGDPSHADIRNVKTSASKAASLVRQLLAFSRKQTLRPTVLELADTLSDGRMLYQRLANPADLKLELGSDIWPVKADLGQFEQVITNLVANARDAMKDGGTIVIAARNLPEAEAATLDYRGFTPGDYVMVEVVDTGTGMPPEVQAQIFDPFYTTKEVGKGTGLGMAMVYGIVKQSGGFIYVDSEVGVGTRFRIMLPRHRVEKASTGAAPTAEAARPARDLTGSGVVLVVEDDNAVRPGAVRALTSRGYTVHEATDGEEALEIMEELNGEVDIIVSDVVMPGMDGPTFLREMRAIYGDDIPFVFASGHAEDAFAKNLPEGSVFSFLPKPCSLSEIATKVKDVLAGNG